MMKKITPNTSLIMDCLQELSDLSYQRRVWVTGEEKVVSGLEDTIASLFDDSSLDFALEKNEVTFSLNIDKRFGELDEMLKELNRAPPTAVIIETEEWGEIALYAENLRNSLI